MARVTVSQLAEVLEKLQAQVAEVSKRLEALEGRKTSAEAISAAGPQPAAQSAAAPPIADAKPQPAAGPEPAAAPPAMTEEELLAVSAVIGAYLGVRVRIRQIRLLSTSAWSQQGRVSIQASHRLQ
jgi:hypothetical protein